MVEKENETRSGLEHKEASDSQTFHRKNSELDQGIKSPFIKDPMTKLDDAHEYKQNVNMLESQLTASAAHSVTEQKDEYRYSSSTLSDVESKNQTEILEGHNEPVTRRSSSKSPEVGEQRDLDSAETKEISKDSLIEVVRFGSENSSVQQDGTIYGIRPGVAILSSIVLASMIYGLYSLLQQNK